MTPEEQVQAIESKCKAEGYADIEEIISAHREALANLKKAEEARDKFADESKELKKHLGSKGGELGFLKQKVEELEKELEQAKDASNSEPAPKQTSTTPKEPSKSVEEELAEVEAALTDDQWELADKMLEAVEDDEEGRKLSRRLALPTKERLDLLKGLREDISLLPRPKSLRPQKKTEQTAPPQDGESLFDQLKKKMTATSIGPQGGVLRARPGMKQEERPIHKAFG